MRGQPLSLGLLVGDGIGPEIVPVAVLALNAALRVSGGPDPTWVALPIGLDAIAAFGTPVPPETIEGLERLDGWLMGPHDSASFPAPFDKALNPSGTLRKHFGLFANIRPARTLIAGGPGRQPVDVVVVRENTEGFYSDRNMVSGSGEFMPTPDVAVTMGVFTRPAIQRIARVAFELARRRNRRVSIVHKANVLPLTNGMFRDVCYEVAAEYEDVRVDDCHVDAAAALLVRRPSDFDVIVTENMFGDILSDLAGELAGSLGAAPALNVSLDRAMAQATHGAAPDIAGRNIANPIAMVLSAAMLLEWIGTRRADPVLVDASHRLESVVRSALERGAATIDLGGTTTTSDLGQVIVDALEHP